MKNRNIFFALSIVSLLSINKIAAQPIPVELMLGNKYGSVNMFFTKTLARESKLGIFHLNSIEFDYNEDFKNSIILKDLLFFEMLQNLKLAGGIIYTNAGFAPQTGLIYSLKTERFLFLFNPGINIESNPTCDIMTILEYRAKTEKKFHLYARGNFLNVFNGDGNLKSYQWLRMGLESNGLSFGFAFNLDEHGPKPKVETNYGLFIQKEIF